MIITPENTRQLITPFEDEVEQVKPSMSMLQQGKLVIEGNVTDEEVRRQQLATLEKQSSQQVRETASIINQQKSIEQMNKLLATETDTTVVSNALKAVAQKQQDNRTALEEEVVGSLQAQASSDPVQRYIMENDRSFFENLSRTAKKELVIQNKLEELRNQSDWVDTTLNIAGEFSLLNFIQRATGFGITDYNDELRELQVKIEKADAEDTARLIDENIELIRATQFLGDNPDYVAGELSAALTGSRESQRTDAILNAIDFADTGLFAKDIVKATGSIVGKRGMTKAALDAGASDKVAEDIVNATNKFVQDPVEAVGVGSGLKTEFDDVDGLSAKVRKEYGVNQRVLNEVLDNFTGMDYEEVQALDIFSNLKDKLKKDFSNGSINDMQLKSDGTADIVLTKASGSPYATQGSAKAALTSRGFTGEVFQFKSGGWGIKANVPALDAKVANLSTKGITAATRLLRRPEAWVDDDLLVFGQISENAMNQITKAGQDVYDNSLGRLSKGQLKDMMPILDIQRNIGQDQKRWMTPQEIDLSYRRLYDRPATEREMNAFAGYRLLNDFQYNLDNKVLYGKKKAQGFGSLEKDVFGFDVNAKLVQDTPKNEFIYLHDTGSVVSKEDIRAGQLDGYDIIEVDDISKFKASNGFADLADNPTPYIAVPKGSVDVKPLRYDQLAYLAGGRIRYDESTVFLKQAVTGKYSNGKTYRKNDTTLFTASSFPQAKRVAEQINSLNAILRKGVDDADVRAEANKFLQERLVLGTDNVDEYLELVNARGMDITDDIHPVRNREMVQKDGLPSEFMGDVDFQQVANGRLSARGNETVPHVDPDETTVLNPVASLNQNFAASAQNAAFSAYRDYTLSYLERYRRYLDIDPSAPRIGLLDAGIKKGSNLTSKQIQRIRGEQIFAREVVGRRTEEELAAIRDVEKGVEWALGKLPNIQWGDKKLYNKDKLTGKLSEGLKEDPVGRVRGLVFNAKLGLFSLPAMIIQAIHAPSIAFMAPKHGTKALLAYPIVRMALLSRDPAVIKEFAKKAEVLGLDGFGDLDMFFREFRNHGFDNFGSNMVYENAARGDTIVRGTGSKVLEKGRIFFEEGEMLPRITAYGTSVREWVANTNGINPKGLAIDSKEARKYIVQRTNTLTLGMTRADLQQGLKSGVLGLAAQFQSYPLRALDAMVFPSKGLSKGERSRLIASYLTLYGSAGFPLMNYFADWAVEAGGMEDSDVVYKTIYNGVVDGLVMAATGEDTNFASRGGLGSWVTEIIDSFSDPNSSPLEVVLGPAGSTGSGAIDTLISYGKAYSAGFNPDPSRILPNVLMDVAKQVSSFNNIYRAWIAYNTGKIYDSRGNQFIDISNKGNLLQIFGVPPQAYEDIGLLYDSKEKRKEVVALNVELMVQLHREFARTQDPAIIEQLNTVGYFVEQDGLADEVYSAVKRKLYKEPTYKALVQEGMRKKLIGEKGAIPLEIEVKND